MFWFVNLEIWVWVKNRRYVIPSMYWICLGPLSKFHLTVWNGKTKMRQLWHFSRWTRVSWLSLSFFIHQFWKRTFGIKWRRLFLQAGCPFRYPTNSVKALKETSHKVLTPTNGLTSSFPHLQLDSSLKNNVPFMPALWCQYLTEWYKFLTTHLAIFTQFTDWQVDIIMTIYAMLL